MAESKIKLMSTVQEIDDFQAGKGRRLNSATHEEILAGATSDIYFVKTQDILARLGRQDVQVTAEIFGRLWVLMRLWVCWRMRRWRFGLCQRAAR